jgi:hypothetical protein
VKTNLYSRVNCPGVKDKDTIVTDGRVSYYGTNEYTASTDQKYEPLAVAPIVNRERFIEYLVMHQDG